MEVKKLMVAHPIVGEMADYKEVFWINPKSGMEADIPFGMDIDLTVSLAELVNRAAPPPSVVTI